MLIIYTNTTLPLRICNINADYLYLCKMFISLLISHFYVQSKNEVAMQPWNSDIFLISLWLPCLQSGTQTMVTQPSVLAITVEMCYTQRQLTDRHTLRQALRKQIQIIIIQVPCMTVTPAWVTNSDFLGWIFNWKDFELFESNRYFWRDLNFQILSVASVFFYIYIYTHTRLSVYTFLTFTVYIYTHTKS